MLVLVVYLGRCMSSSRADTARLLPASLEERLKTTNPKLKSGDVYKQWLHNVYHMHQAKDNLQTRDCQRVPPIGPSSLIAPWPTFTQPGDEVLRRRWATGEVCLTGAQSDLDESHDSKRKQLY